MKTIRNFLALAFGIMGALLLAPFVAIFGLVMLGLAFGLSLITAGAVTAWARASEAEGMLHTTEEPVGSAA